MRGGETMPTRVRNLAASAALAACLAAALPASPVAASKPTGEASGSPQLLGTIDFPSSGAPAAQVPFLRGVAALHSFWYDEAADAFRAAQAADPGFALAYWGEAMTYNHPLWNEQDAPAARAVLARLAPTPEARAERAPTAREKAWLAAVETLYSGSDDAADKRRRDLAYAEAMRRLYEADPGDHEAACFYALALLGSGRPGEPNLRNRMRAAAILEEVFAANPDHPGAAHYLIHAYDDPDHAALGLRAALRYAEIAPAAPHALHMPSHIFLQLGMWDRAAAANEAAYAASVAWATRKSLSPARRDLHSLAWLEYAYLQQGRWAKAAGCLGEVEEIARVSGERRAAASRDAMTARYLIETGRWGARALPDHDAAAGARHGAGAVLLAAGLGAVAGGDLVAAGAAGARLAEAASQAGEGYEARPLALMAKEVAGVVALARGDTDTGLALLTAAATLEDELDAPSGPPEPAQPAHELLGQALLRLGRPREAAEQFASALARTPNRTAALAGAARSALAVGDTAEAHRLYADLARRLSAADSDLPLLAEAKAHLGP